LVLRHWSSGFHVLITSSPHIEGQEVQFVFGQLYTEMKFDNRELVREMNNSFRVVETKRSFAAHFSCRKQRSCKTAEDYALDHKML
jgi:hypothetical protein